MSHVIDDDALRSLRERLSAAHGLFAIAIAATGVTWFGYGLLAPAVYAADPMPAPGWFRWEAFAIPSMALAVIIGASRPSRRALPGLAALAVAVIVGLGAGIVMGGGLDGAASERAYVAFAAGTLVVLTVCWLLGVAVGAIGRRADLRARREGSIPTRPGGLRVRSEVLDDLPLGLSLQVPSVSAVGFATWALMAGVVVLLLAGLGYVEEVIGPPEPSFPPSTQVGAGVTVTVGRVRWAAEDHAFLPRVGERTVALRLRYVATSDDVAYDTRDWTARDDRGRAYEATLWPNRRPLGAGTLGLGDRLFGWIAFVVPDATDWLDVTLREPANPPLTWRVDDAGAHVVAVETAPPRTM